MTLQTTSPLAAIPAVKRQLRSELPNYADVFAEVENEMRRKVAAIVRERNAGDPVIPIVQYDDIERGEVAGATIADIQERGACVIRRVFSEEQAREWNDEIGRYVDDNGLTERLTHAAEDKYFGTLAAAKPQ